MTTPVAHRGAVLIPVKAFEEAKVRLSDALEPHQRATLAEQMATHVVQAQRGVHVAVCCDDDGVAQWAERTGAHVIWCPGTDLNQAVQQAFGELRDQGMTSVAVAHGDLPLAASLHELLGWPGVTLVPDRHRSGTNVLVAPTNIDFRFQYGIGSLALHIAEAVRHRQGMRITHDARLGWDVDHPTDLDLPEGTRLTAGLLDEHLERQTP